MANLHGEFERLSSVLGDANEAGPLTAREILNLLEDEGEEFDSAHRVATILGRRAQTGEVEVIRDQPYRYAVPDESD
jgi:hypothetical protein